MTKPDAKEDNSEAVQDILREGSESKFWKIICQHIQNSIDSIDEAILHTDRSKLTPEDYKIDIEVLRKRKEAMEDLIGLPETVFNELEEPESLKQDRDEEIYPTKEDFEEQFAVHKE